MRCARYRVPLLVLGLISFLSACSPRYAPVIAPHESPATIPARVQFDRLVEVWDDGDEQPYGLISPESDTIDPGVLAQPLAEALVEDLRSNRVFASIGSSEADPDFILRGVVRQFYEHFRPKPWTRLPGGGILSRALGVNTHVSSGQVELELELVKPDGAPVGHYRGHAEFADEFIESKKKPGVRLNKALSSAVRQIRRQMVDDPRLQDSLASAPSPAL